MNSIRKAHVIHYTKLSERKANMLQYFSETDMELNFIELYDQEDLSEDLLDGAYSPNETSFENKIAELRGFGVTQKENRFRRLTGGELSCILKHIEAIRLIAEGDEEFGLILEDDAVPTTPEFLEVLDKILQNAGSDWDAIFLGAGCGLSFINSKLLEGHERITNELFKVSHPATNCAEAYLLKKSSAKKLYNSILPFNLAGDWELAYQFYKLDMEVYWCAPPIFEQGSKNGMFTSALR